MIRMRLKMIKIQKAFTLAEVLITLGVVGVVAALTLPTLIAKYDEMVMINKIKRSYSELANAIEMRKAEMGTSDYATPFNPSLSSAEQLDGFVKFLKVTERCSAGSSGCGGKICLLPKNKTNDGFGNIKDCLINIQRYERAVLSDGTIVFMDKKDWVDNCMVQYSKYETDEKGNYTNVVNGKPVSSRYYKTQHCA